MNFGVTRKALLPLSIVLVLFAVYFLAVKQAISAATASLIEFIVLAAMILTLMGCLILVIVTFIKQLIRKMSLSALARRVGFMLSVAACLLIFVACSQWTAYTPPMHGSDGKPLTNSLAVLEKVSLGGVDQWLIIRGEDVNKPVLLFLSGGPGASEAGRVLRFNKDLEKDFIVVIWEQRGCGKSYPSIRPQSDLTVEQYTSDVIELTEMLRERFDEQKIYLVGHSWGTIIGVHAAQARPDLFHAYIGSAQMVNILETDQLIYQNVLDHSRRTGDVDFVKTLEEQGPPPYFGNSPIQPYSALFGREYSIYEYPNIKNEAYRKDGDALLLMLKQPEYGLLDRVYYLLGLMNTFNVVYPQLQAMDFRVDATHFNLPIYLILGRHDMNNPSQIPESYFNQIEAPRKQLIFFEESGHGMIWEQAELFHQIMVETVIAETYIP